MNKTTWDTRRKMGDSDSEYDIFLVSYVSHCKKPIIDTGASKSFISERELQQWLKNMPDNRRQKIVEENRDQICGSFKIGTGTAIKTKRTVNLPVSWKNLSIQSEVKCYGR